MSINSTSENLEAQKVIPIRSGMHLSQTHGAGRENAKPFNGPLSESMWLRANRVKSAYHDTFDYGIYDRLHERFGEKQPRGGVVFNTPIKAWMILSHLGIPSHSRPITG